MKIALIASVIASTFIVMPAAAREVVVQMKNRGAGNAIMVFEPAFVRVMPGDTVRFVPTDPSHNAETITGMLPNGATPIKGPLNKEVVMTAKVPGLYGIKCLPHLGMGMVALVQVGKGPSSNFAAAKAVKLPPLAARRMIPMLASAK